MYLVRATSHTFLLESGLFQGPRQGARQINFTFSFVPRDMEFLLLSHARLDHSGNIPTLVKQGFSGKIYATGGVLIPSCSKIQLDSPSCIVFRSMV